MKTLELVVYGVAQAKGSIRAFMPKGFNRPVLTSTNRNLAQWEALVRQEAQKHAPQTFFDGPVRVVLNFYLPRPQSLPRKVTHHMKKPDLDKLTRGILDALTPVVWRDDAQVVDVRATKHYQDDRLAPCVSIYVEELPIAESQPKDARSTQLHF